MYKHVKFRLDPTPAQARLLESHFGGMRAAYNWCINHNRQLRDAGKKQVFNAYALRKEFNIEKAELFPWWAENSKECYSDGINRYVRAMRQRFNSLSGKRKGEVTGSPRYKSRHADEQSYKTTTGSFGICDSHGVRVPRVGRVHALENVELAKARIVPTAVSDVRSMTISRRNGKYYASLLYEVEEYPRKHTGEHVGVDLGVKELATLSNGEVVENLRFGRTQRRRLARFQRSLSRKRRGSNRYHRASRRVANLSEHIANQRRDRVEKVTTDLVTRFDRITIEDLNVRGMLKNHHLSYAVQDVSFSMIRDKLTAKAAQHGCEIVVADRFFPSSKTCSSCGHVMVDLTLADRTYVCPECGLVIDRDLNAAINLDEWSEHFVASSTGETLNGRGGDARPLAAVPGEASTSDRLESRAATLAPGIVNAINRKRF